MKKCNDCNIEMVESINLHTDYVGGASMDERIYIEYYDEKYGEKRLFSNEKISIRRVKGRVCPNCGKVELYVDLIKK